MPKPDIFLLNGNANRELTSSLHAQAHLHLGSSASLFSDTVDASPRFIGTPEEVAEAAHHILAYTSTRFGSEGADLPDAMVLACFGEPGLAALRQQLPFPVFGLLESAAIAAIDVAEDFAVLTPGREWPPQLWDLLTQYGLETKCRSISVLSDDALQADPDHWKPALQAEIEHTAAEFRPGAILVGGAIMSGRAAELSAPAGTVLIDPLQAALRQALNANR